MALRIKRYEEPASELPRLLREIRQQLGPGAKVHTRRFRKGGLLGLIGGREMVEVVAMVETDAVRTATGGKETTVTLATPSTPSSSPPSPKPETKPEAKPNGNPKEPTTASPPREKSEADLLDELRREIIQIRRQLAHLQQLEEEERREGRLPAATSLLGLVGGEVKVFTHPSQQEAFEELLEWDIPPTSAMELITKATRISAETGGEVSKETILSRVKRIICSEILLSEGIHLPADTTLGRTVALIGPTGVGKTTTIAKLAAEFLFNRQKRVSLLSLDTYRIAAAEQLRTYAEIMGIPLDVVFSKSEFDEVMARHREQYEITFIDTAGRSTFDQERIGELAGYFEAHPPDEIHLVIDTTTKRDDIRHVLKNFGEIGFDYLILSKLDETNSLGTIYNINQMCRKPISYFTVGQEVPDDLRVADLAFVSRWMETGKF